MGDFYFSKGERPDLGVSDEQIHEEYSKSKSDSDYLKCSSMYYTENKSLRILEDTECNTLNYYKVLVLYYYMSHFKNIEFP